MLVELGGVGRAVTGRVAELAWVLVPRLPASQLSRYLLDLHTMIDQATAWLVEGVQTLGGVDLVVERAQVGAKVVRVGCGYALGLDRLRHTPILDLGPQLV